MVSGGRFRGGGFARQPTPRRARQKAQPGGRSVDDVLNQHERAAWAREQTEAIVGAVQQEESIVPYWLEPIGDSGFYVTPNEPVDPWDCDRYSDSPWCGGSGVDPMDLITLQPASATPGFSTNQDLSEFCVDIGINLFAVALPSYTACYRAPWARPLPPREQPELPQTDQHQQFIVPPQFFPLSFPATGSGCIHIAKYRYMDDGNPDRELRPYTTYSDRQSQPYVIGRPSGYWVWAGKTILFSSNESGSYRPTDTWYLMIVSTTAEGVQYNEHYFNFYSDVRNVPPTVLDVYPINLPGQPKCIPDPPPPPPITPPPQLPSEPMSCCNTAEIEEMLRVIMLRLGTTSYPVEVPKSLVDDSKDTEAQQSLTELLFWTIKQMDALAGQFPIDIEIKDADPSQEGDQARKVTIPNIAEGIAELLGLNIRTSVNSDIHTSFLMRLAAEIIATKNASLVTQDYAKANASYLGYKGNTVKRKVNYSFNATNLDTLDKILEETEKEIVGWQDEDKNTVQDYLEKLMFAAGIIKQTFFRPNSDKDKLLDQISNVLGVKDQSDNSDDPEEKGWKEFLKVINDPEGGFNRNSPTTPKVIDPSDISKIDVKYRSPGDGTTQATGGR